MRGDAMRLFDAEALDCLSWTDGEYGTTFDDGVKWVLSKIDEQPPVESESKLTNDQIWEELSKVYNMPDVPDEAKEIIGNLMLALDDGLIVSPLLKKQRL